MTPERQATLTRLLAESKPITDGSPVTLIIRGLHFTRILDAEECSVLEEDLIGSAESAHVHRGAK